MPDVLFDDDALAHWHLELENWNPKDSKQVILTMEH